MHRVGDIQSCGFVSQAAPSLATTRGVYVKYENKNRQREKKKERGKKKAVNHVLFSQLVHITCGVCLHILRGNLLMRWLGFFAAAAAAAVEAALQHALLPEQTRFEKDR